MSAGAYDDLFDHYGGNGRSWYSKISPDAREWIDGLADHVAELGREPNWAASYRVFLDEYPKDAPETDTTIKETVRKLVRSRG